MIANEILCHLKELGFTEYEAKIYLALLDRHPASAYTLSQTSGVPHSRVYDIARRLIRKGLAVTAEKNPERFSPIPPAELIAKLKRDSDQSIGALETGLERISYQSDFDPVWNITNRDEALNVARSLIADAEFKIYMGIWDEELFILKSLLEKAQTRGVEIFLLVYGEAVVDSCKVYYHSTDSLKSVIDLGRTIDCAVDSAACISGSLGEREPCRVVWTRNRGLVKSIEEYIIHDLYLAEIQRIFGASIEEKFGSNLSRLRKKFSL